MHAHGCAGSFRITPLDGVVDILVFAVHAIEVTAGIVMRKRRGIYTRAWNDRVAQLAKDAVEITVARSLGKLEVKCDVCGNRVARAFCNVPLELVQSMTHVLQILFASPHCRETCGLGFETDAQFEDGHDVAHGEIARSFDLEAIVIGRFEYKSANAMTRLNQAPRLKARYRFSYDRTANAQLRHDLRFGRKLVARLKRAAANPFRKFGDNFLGQIARAAKTAGCESW